MKPTQPHLTTAQRIYDRLGRGSVADIDAIAAALAEAEHDGASNERERCSDLLAAISGVFKRCGIDNDWTALMAHLSEAILSEAES